MTRAAEHTTLVLPAGCTDPRVVGGKGAALGRLVRAGARVPPTAVVTTDAYRAFVASAGLRPLIDRARRSPGGVPADEVDRAFSAAEVPRHIARAVRAAARELAGGDGALAVRSSASAEDTAERSFAGQYRSYLGRRDDDEVLEAVVLVWASLWHPAPCAYRQAWGVADDDVAMAVVLMRMVDADQAGVAFSVDPAGRPDHVRVEAVTGLGEALVSGARTPQVWLVPRHPAVAATEGVPALAGLVARQALAAEELFGVPEDVEWAWDGHQLWVVQARPITTGSSAGDGADTPLDGHELTTAGIAEMLPGAIPPLVWDVAGCAVEEAMRSVFDDLGALPDGLAAPHAFIRRARGRAALDLDLFEVVAAAAGGSAHQIEAQYFGEGSAASDGDEHRGAPGEPASAPARAQPRRRRRRPGVLHGLRAAAARHRALHEAELVSMAIEAVTDAPLALDQLDARQLVAYHDRLVDLGTRALAAEVAVAATAAAAYRRLQATLEPHLGGEAEREAQVLTAAAGATRPPHPRASRSIFAGPTWEEAGTPPGEAAARPAAPTTEARTALEGRLQAAPRWRRVRILTGQVVDVRVHLLRRLIDDAVDALGRRERAKADVLLLGGEVRRVHLEVGRRLQAGGALRRAADVDLLRRRELRRALAGTAPPLAELDRRGRALDRANADGELPVRFVGRPGPVEAVAALGQLLHGLAASPGRHTGTARVVDDPTAPGVGIGDVVVARATDAAWSPLFLRAGAVVVERGGPLSHAAIVARELGLPAVLAVAGAASVLDGRMVTVDGDAGTVLIHDPVDAGGGGRGGLDRRADEALEAPEQEATGAPAS